jgi:hypothetical protein
MKFDELRYPASMSSYLYGPNNELLAKDRELRVINRFSGEYDYWGTFYSLMPLTGTKDIGEEINKAIEEAGGEGIVNVKVMSETNSLDEFPFLGEIDPLLFDIEQAFKSARGVEFTYWWRGAEGDSVGLVQETGNRRIPC